MSSEWSHLPDFDSLPKVEGMPQGCAWGVFDKDGKKDRLGCLNLLTPSVVKEAYKELRDGDSVSLNWALGAIESPGFARKGLVHKTFAFAETPVEAYRCVAFDDEIEFNTQCSSQWDSLVHFGHQASGLNYNGAKPDKADLVQAYGHGDLEGAAAIPTLNHWHARGGLVARGVLLDYRAWSDAHGNPNNFHCFDGSRITVQDLEAVAAWEGVTLRLGDVIIIRTGFTEELDAAGSGSAQQELLGSHRVCGVLGSKASARWFWNHHPCAVAGDAIAFENIPPLPHADDLGPAGTDGTKDGAIADLVLHQYFLSLFGLPIGELWDLKELSRVCGEKKRYSFLVTSVPLNVPGAVGSPPNALALF